MPIPDRIKGQPNPGRTRITQQRTEPEREESDPFEAEARPVRSAPIDPLTRPTMTPWLRDIVRAYFLRQRAEDVESNANPPESTES